MGLHSRSIVRRACGMIAGAMLAVAGTSAALAQERLAMPYACAVDGGRLLVEPSPERSYAILGRHDQEPYAVCSRFNASRCRTWMLHRFELECDGGRVSWLQVVAAAPPARARQVWLENGRLHLRSGPGRTEEAGNPCVGGQGAFPDGRDCGPYRPRKTAAIALPPGFAPLLQLGARIVSAPLPPPRADEPARQTASTPVPRQVSGAGEKQVPPARPGGEQRQSASAPAAAAWRTSTRLETSGADLSAWRELRTSLAARAPAAGVAAAVLLALLGAAFAWRRRLRPPAGAAPAGAGAQAAYRPELGAEAPTRAAVEDLMRNADDFYVHVVQLARQMQGGDALRDVVADELAAVDATLRAPDLAHAYAAEGWAQVRQCAVQVLTDLERIRRIVQSANEAAIAPSPPARPGHPIPATREDALAVLGVNAEASEKVIKKIVDAMRQTWHPDLARNDIDRRAREERMKQINIAWDMLRTRRQAA